MNLPIIEESTDRAIEKMLELRTPTTFIKGFLDGLEVSNPILAEFINRASAEAPFTPESMKYIAAIICLLIDKQLEVDRAKTN